MTPLHGFGEGQTERASGSILQRPGRKPNSPILRALLTGSYNDFYQTIYGYENIFHPPEALLDYLELLLVTTQTQLETLFVLWNAAQGRSPFEDARSI